MSCYVLQRGKPTLTRPREYLILERRKQEELREEANAMVNYNKQFDLKVCAATWIISTKSHSCHRAFLHWSICSRNHLGPHSATAIDKKFLFKWKNTVIPLLQRLISQAVSIPFSSADCFQCRHMETNQHCRMEWGWLARLPYNTHMYHTLMRAHRQNGSSPQTRRLSGTRCSGEWRGCSESSSLVSRRGEKSERPLECLICYFSVQNFEYW